MLNDNTKLLGNPLVQFMMLTSPKLLKNFPYFDKIFHAAIKNSNNVTEFLDHQIAEHRKRFSVEGEPEEATNYVQAFLMEMNKREKNGDVGNFTIKQLLDMCNDLWNAGQETTATTTNFGILYIMTHPVTQQKIQAEIDRVVGSERKVSLNDRPNLPYTNAVCNETQRLCNLLPQNLLHRTTKDIFINGYKIKKGTSIVPQISCVLFDQKTFPNPETFEPERFLDETGKLKRVDEFIPFSIRPSDPNQTLEKINGLAVQPPPFKCNVERRIPIIH
uniref:Cytochrome P450 n=1 Tax=Acrobeloides nanus TaxID=290746 RepID=A0A914DGL8_9BILA